MTATSGAPVAGGGAADGAALVLDTHTLLSGGGALAGLSRPRIVVDGHEHTGRWGRNELPVAPGADRAAPPRAWITVLVVGLAAVALFAAMTWLGLTGG